MVYLVGLFYPCEICSKIVNSFRQNEFRKKSVVIFLSSFYLSMLKKYKGKVSNEFEYSN